MGAIVIRMRYDEGTESAEVATSADILLHNISDFTCFYYIDARSVPSGVYAHEGCAVVTFQKLGYPYTERKNKQGSRWRFNGFSVI
jgi:hypothetical protein